MEIKLSLLDIAIMNGYTPRKAIKKLEVERGSYAHSLKKLTFIGYITEDKIITPKGEEALKQFEEVYNEIKTMAD